METLVRATRRWQQQATANVVRRLGGHRDRGDVPGWVLITLMTAGIVTVLWGFAGDKLLELFSDAIGNVSGVFSQGSLESSTQITAAIKWTGRRN